MVKLKLLLAAFLIAATCQAQTFSTGTPKTIKAAHEISQANDVAINKRIDSIVAILKKPTSEPPTPVDTTQKNGLVFSKFMGINGVHEDRVTWINPVAGTARLYTNRDWFEGDISGDVLRFQNSRGGWYFDDAYQKCKAAGIDIMMCLQLGGIDKPNKNDKPTNASGQNTRDPRSYTKIASTYFNVAARYGTVKHNAATLRSDDKKSGLNLIKYLEVWNEQDKGWEGPNANFAPEEYAALLSICYDSIKKADPNIIVVMGGLAGQDINYIKKMEAWFKANRQDKQFAADVINIHIYALNNTIDWSQNPWPLPMGAETPEDARFHEKMKEFADYSHAIGKQFFVSEFGWDTHPESPLYPKKVNGIDPQEMQSRYLLRAYLEFAAAGVTAVQQYELVDPSQEQWGGGLYATSGLIKRDNNLDSESPTKKKSWFAIQEMKQVLGDYKLSRIIQRDKAAHIYEFVKDDQKIYAAWLPTSTNQSKTVTVNGKAVTLTERPQFIKP